MNILQEAGDLNEVRGSVAIVSNTYGAVRRDTQKRILFILSRRVSTDSLVGHIKLAPICYPTTKFTKITLYTRI